MRMYEVTPIRIVLPAVPTLEAKPRPLSEVRDEQVIHITGATTLSTTLSDAQRKAQAMLAETRARVEGGHPEARFVVVDPLSPSDPLGDLWQLVLRDYDPDWPPSEDLAGRVPVEPLGAGVPARDHAVERHADDRVVRGLHDRRGESQRRFGLATLLGDVDSGSATIATIPMKALLDPHPEHGPASVPGRGSATLMKAGARVASVVRARAVAQGRVSTACIEDGCHGAARHGAPRRCVSDGGHCARAVLEVHRRGRRRGRTRRPVGVRFGLLLHRSDRSHRG